LNAKKLSINPSMKDKVIDELFKTKNIDEKVFDEMKEK
jgi:hypothetical protein